MDKESDRTYRHTETCLQSNGISPAQARRERSALELCQRRGPGQGRLGSQVFGKGGQALSG